MDTLECMPVALSSAECVELLDELLTMEMKPKEHNLLRRCKQLVLAENEETVPFGLHDILALGQLALAYPEKGTSVTAMMMYISDAVEFVKNEDSNVSVGEVQSMLNNAMVTAFQATQVEAD